MTDKVLLVWEELPEDVRYVALPATDENIAVLEAAHGKIAKYHGGDTDPCIRISYMMYDIERYPIDEDVEFVCEELDMKKGDIGSWFECIVDDPKSVGPVSAVYRSGMVM